MQQDPVDGMIAVMKTVLLLAQDQIGQGDPELGQKILATLLRKAPGAFPELETIALMHGGVRLACEGSPTLVELAQLHEQGVDVLCCGTCLDHYGLSPAVGQVSDMDTILREIERAEKVVRL
ncbi:MAG: DsrE family protein [Planctomycetota bacterium]|nr:DsrE family protein [Planctomycetota bacterium]